MLCRLCIFECDDGKGLDILSNENDLDMRKLIKKFLFLEIAEGDEMSSKICSDCVKHLKEFDDFCVFVDRRQKCLKATYCDDESVYLANGQLDAEYAQLENKQVSLNDKMPNGMEFADSLNYDLFTNVADSEKQLLFQEGYETAVNSTPTPCNMEQKNKILITKKSQDYWPHYNIVQSQPAITDEKDKFIEEHVQLKCKICRAVLDSFKNFQRHFRVKHNCPAYIKCCGSRFYSRQRMVKHIQSHVNPDLFKCQICNKSLSSQKNLESHIASFHTAKEELKNICEVCGDRFTTPFILRTHMIVHEEGNNYTCEICKKSFKHLRSVKRHKRLQHGTILSHVCELCGKNYKYKQIFEQHMADKHNIILKETMKYCEECKIWFSTKYDKKHAERHEAKEVDCKHCGKIYPSKAALNKHLDSHYHKKKCQTCGNTFNHAKDLREHMKTHACDNFGEEIICC